MKVADGIHQNGRAINKYRTNVDTIVDGILPGKGRELHRVCEVNKFLEKLLADNKLRAFYIAPDIQEWTTDGKQDLGLYGNDQLHLSNLGYEKMVKHIQRISEQTTLPLYPAAG